jgi:segregation and condensation protein A
MERDTLPASAELVERKVIKTVPQVTLQEMLLAFRDVVSRSNMFAHHHVQRERLSVRQRMSDILGALKQNAWVEFVHLFQPEEGRMGVSVTFSAILELMREGLIEIVQAEVYGPLHVRPASGGKHLSVVAEAANDAALSETADVENIAALAQPAQPDENQEWDPDAESESVVETVNIMPATDSNEIESLATVTSIDAPQAEQADASIEQRTDERDSSL